MQAYTDHGDVPPILREYVENLAGTRLEDVLIEEVNEFLFLVDRAAKD